MAKTDMETIPWRHNEVSITFIEEPESSQLRRSAIDNRPSQTPCYTERNTKMTKVFRILTIIGILLNVSL